MRREWTTTAAAVAISVGALLRGSVYAAGHSLWLDETMLSLNVAERSFAALAQPLAFSQVAPVPFLWLLKLATLIGGVNELSLRIVPLLAGIVLLGLQWWVARRLLGASAGIAAVTLAAISPILLRYSYEVKQYELDALAALGVVALVVSVLDAPDHRTRWAWLGIGGAVAMLISQPAVLVVAGAMSALILDRTAREAPGWTRHMFAVGGLWLVTFGTLYLLLYRHAAHAGLYKTWTGMFLPLGPGFIHRLLRAVSTGLTLALPEHVADAPAWLAGIGCLGGLALVWRERGPAGVAIVLVPFGAALAAASVGKYPLGARTLTFTAPLWILGYAAALAWIGRVVLRDTLPYVWAGCLVGFGVLGVFGAQADSWTIPVTEDARTVIHWVDANRRDDPVYVLHESLPAWAFYTTDWERPDSAHLADIRAATFRNSREIVLHDRTLSPSSQGGTDLVRAIDLLGSRSDAAWREGAGWVGGEGIGRWANEEAAQIRAATSDHIWVVASHYRPEELQALLQSLHELGGSVVQSYQLTGAEAYRLQLRHSESATGG